MQHLAEEGQSYVDQLHVQTLSLLVAGGGGRRGQVRRISAETGDVASDMEQEYAIQEQVKLNLIPEGGMPQGTPRREAL